MKTVKYFKNKMVLGLYALAALPAMAQSLVPDGMTDLTQNILGIFTGPIVKTALIIMLAACAVAYGFNKDNEKIKRNVIAIAIAIAIIGTSTFVVDAVWTASQA
jgi:type IV secretory pathway VirB2 component (pilin)